MQTTSCKDLRCVEAIAVAAPYNTSRIDPAVTSVRGIVINDVHIQTTSILIID